MTAPRRASLRELAIVYAMAVTAFAYFVGTWQDPNTYSRLALVDSLVNEHRFEIDSSQTTGDDNLRTSDRSVYNGHYYSDKAIGSSLIGAVTWAPVHGLLEAIGVSSRGRVLRVAAPFFGVSLVCALLAPLVYAFVMSVSGGSTALLVAIVIVFGTPIFKYSTGYYGHVQAGLFVFAAFLMWFHARRRRRLSHLQVFASCALLGFTVVTEYPAAVLALLLGGYIVFVLHDVGRLTDWRPYVVGAAGGLLGVSPLLIYNHAVFGSAFTTGYQHHATAKFAAAHATGLSGIGLPDPVVMFTMTFHPLMGIVCQSPVLILAAAGWMAMPAAGRRAELWFSLSAMVAYVALISGYYEWPGGLAYAPRHLVPILPLFAIPLAFLPRRWAALGWGLAAVSVVQHLIPVAARLEDVSRLVRSTLDANGHPTTWFVSTIWTVCWQNLLAGLFLKNRGTIFISDGFLSLVPLFVIEAALAALLVRTMTRLERTEPSRQSSPSRG